MNLKAALAVSAAILASAVLQASPSMGEQRAKHVEGSRVSRSDFWYVVSDAGMQDFSPTRIEGIVIPSGVEQAVQMTAAGAVLAWTRADGTRQSFVVQGVSALDLKPGPLQGTTYIPFTRWLSRDDSCCACASWNNMVESVEEFSCVPGCTGCGCEACICDRLPCPGSPGGRLRLVPHADVASSVAFDRSGPAAEIEFRSDNEGLTSFRGNRLIAKVSTSGELILENPDSITIPSGATSRGVVTGESAIYGWSAPGVSVIVEQASRAPAPRFQDGVIDFEHSVEPESQSMGKVLAFDPDSYRCRICGVHPNSDGDLDRMVCIPGGATCYRCVEFNCVASEL
jgi:hypothetical protein